jgi:gamma-glutamyl-gamma-aminobutyraldehyde dehydrogenase
MKAIGQTDAEGATLVLGDEQLTIDGVLNFIQPTIFSNVTGNMRISREEVFGPVLAISDFDSEEEAVQQASDSIYGLAASVWSDNPCGAL